MALTHWIGALCVALAALAAQAQPQAPVAEKVFRYAFPISETGFDPQQLSDLYSRTVTSNIFEGLYAYEYLARPAKVRPSLAEGMPDISPDFKVYTVRMKRGVYFADDAAFNGKKREVTAHDVVFTFKRIFDPKLRSALLSGLQEERILGLDQLREKAEKSGKFDYDTEIEGLRALDRYTVQFQLGTPRPRFIYTLADPSVYGVVAREVVEKYGDQIMGHPVGTGPFMLAEWKRSSRITLVKNPNYRGEIFDETAPAGDQVGEQLARHLKGKRMPLVDKVVVSIIDEPQPRWLSFLGGEHELMERLPANFVTQAIPNNTLAPNLAQKGVQMERVPLSDIAMMLFNMKDPVVGGYSPEKVALRRAIGLAYNSGEEVRLARRGQAIVANGPLLPNTASYEPDFRSEMGVFDRARAIALLDMFGYTDKNGDGWRDLPDGSPLEIEMNTLSTTDYRELDEIVKKNMDAVRVKFTFKIGKVPEQLKAARAGRLQVWQVALSAASPDSGMVLQLGYGPQAAQLNFAFFSNKKFDELFERQGTLPDGPERDALLREAARIWITYMPYKVRVHRIGTDLWQPWVIGYKRHPFSQSFWRYIDIDTARLQKK